MLALDLTRLQHHHLSILVVVLVLPLISCGDDNRLRSEAGVLTQPGSVWTYEVERRSAPFPSVSPYDTVDVTVRALDVPSGIHFYGHPAALWQISYGTQVETTLVYVAGDTVEIWPRAIRGLRVARDMFVFPLQSGNRWGHPDCCGDTSEVTTRVAINVPAGDFDTFKIDRHAWGFNYQLTSTTWFNRSVGIVKLYESVYDLGPAGTNTWQLTSYVPGKTSEGSGPLSP